MEVDAAVELGVGIPGGYRPDGFLIQCNTLGWTLCLWVYYFGDCDGWDEDLRLMLCSLRIKTRLERTR